MRVVLCLLALSLAPVTARAESAPPPDVGTIDAARCDYTPGQPHTSPAAGEVPADWPRFLVRLSGGAVDMSTVRLEIEASGIEVTTRIGREGDGVHVVPAAPLDVGETYRLVHPTCPGAAPETTIFVAVEPAAPATSLGTLAVSPLYASYDARGHENLRYFVRVTLTLDPTMTPWIELYEWALIVNTVGGVRAPLDFLAVDVPIGCNPRFPGEPEGPLALGADATSRWIEHVVVADSLTTTIVCGDATKVHLADLEPLTPEEIAFYETPDLDGRMDAGIEAGGVDGGRMGMHTEPDTRSTCSVVAPGRGQGAAVAWTLALLGLALVVRRRGR